LAHHTVDDGFHEIQLNGKQLVFLFMAATVVSVVIFLCGVLVGRGVRAERGIAADSATIGDVPPVPTSVVSDSPAAGTDPRSAAPPTPVDDLSYFGRLERENAGAEELKPASAGAEPPASAGAEPPAPAAAESAAPAAAPPSVVSASTPPPAASPRAPAAAPTERTAAPPATAGTPYAVQIAALNDRKEADAMARRLSSKGYAAYVVAPAHGTPAVYRVRIGTFKTRREAESMAARLQKEEQVKPWVTR
jgi:cell division septation protein DedD